MIRKLFLLAAAGLLCGAVAVAADDETWPDPGKPGKGKFAGRFDKAKLFDRLDADGDGKITKEEFKKFAEVLKERLKDAGKGGKAPAGLGDRLFEKMDANGDGKITKEEFEKYEFPGAAGLKGKGKEQPEKKPADKKDADKQ